MDDSTLRLIGMILAAVPGVWALLLQGKKDKSLEKTDTTKIVLDGATEVSNSALALMNAMEERMNNRINTAEARICDQAKTIADQAEKIVEQSLKIADLEEVVRSQRDDIDSTSNGVKILIKQIKRLGHKPDWEPKEPVG